ncbi:ABC transporter permease [Christensenella tenuis]|uniref:ABC transporter permease n=1 Tax=Christensenella tenuis TaxID=2763033 RepID=A0ABR7EE63_9FIRM|nr:ABC transporter permease [Christensenella tenuis]MBC5647304.1 ABC transporter permease [Christensenella tenuis]
MSEEVKELKKNTGWHKFVREYSIILVAVGLIIVATILGGSTFMNGQNFINIFRNNTVLGIIAFGMAFVIITGNIDLSVGTQLVVVGIVLLSVLNATGNIVIALIVAVLFSCALSAGVGAIITKGRVPSFIVTLGMQYIYRSLAIFILDARGISGEVDAFQQISNYEIGGVFPLPLIYFAVVFFICFYISKYTVLGRRIYAVGSNEQATRLSGIDTDKVKIMAFVLMGLTVAIATIIEASRMNSINSASSGNGYELNAIAMAVVGGIAMEGGKGHMIGVLFGVIILGVINNILTIVGMNVYLVNAVKGAIIIGAVLLQHKKKD